LKEAGRYDGVSTVHIPLRKIKTRPHRCSKGRQKDVHIPLRKIKTTAPF